MHGDSPNYFRVDGYFAEIYLGISLFVLWDKERSLWTQNELRVNAILHRPEFFLTQMLNE